MSVCTLFTLILFCVILAAMVNRGHRRSTRPPARPGTAVVPRRPSGAAVRNKPSRPRKSRPQPAPASNRAAGLSAAQTRAILERALGAVWEAEQERIRAQVREQERRIAARLRQGQRALDFIELRSLHEKSRQTADLAYASLDSARATEQAISENIRNTHRAIQAEQGRGGRGVATMRQTLDALHVDRDVIRTYRDRYEQDVHRLNRETGRLRDSIGANCGAQGRRWHQALTERTKARKEGRR
jgi:hypothetical protein